jgi:hypothetical protein
VRLSAVGRLLVVSAFIGLVAPRVQAGGDTTKPGEPTKVTAQGNGFFFELPIWRPALHGDPRKLTATYTWNGKDSRHTDAVKQGAGEDEVWRLTFPDQPKPDEVAKLELRYDFELLPANKVELKKLAGQLVGVILNAGVEATGSPDFAAALASKVDQVLTTDAAQGLRKYATADGETDAVLLVLDRLGFKKMEGVGWSIVAGSKLEQVAGSMVKNRAYALQMGAARTELATASHAGRDARRKCGPIDDVSKLDPKTAIAILQMCLPEVARDLEVAAAKEAAPGKTELQAAAETLRTAVGKLSDQSVLGDVQQSLLMAEAHAADGYSIWANKLALTIVVGAMAEAAWNDTEARLVAEIETATERTLRTEVGSTLVQGADRPRRYDIATGVLYVGGIKDMIVPTLVSICFSTGCLAAKEVAWGANSGWVRAFSVDAGVRLKTLDSQDPRQLDKISFVMGVSFNPVSLLRLSAGYYAFENAQTKNWNAQPYFGVTLNILNAAEILGALGLGEATPKVDPVK